MQKGDLAGVTRQGGEAARAGGRDWPAVGSGEGSQGTQQLLGWTPSAGQWWSGTRHRTTSPLPVFAKITAVRRQSWVGLDLQPPVLGARVSPEGLTVRFL